MTEPIAVRDRWILHFTHLDNLASIAASGVLACDAQAQEGYLATEVGDLEIKANRRRRMVPIGPGGTVGDYVPFYYAPRSPMMYRIACDCRDAIPNRYQGGDRELVFLRTRVGSIMNEGLSWVATDGNAASEISRFSNDLDEMNEMIDWPLMFEQIWRNVPEDQDRQRRRMAELLVHRQVPLRLVQDVAVYGEEQAQRARVALRDRDLTQRIIVRAPWYYGYERR